MCIMFAHGCTSKPLTLSLMFTRTENSNPRSGQRRFRSSIDRGLAPIEPKGIPIRPQTTNKVQTEMLSWVHTPTQHSIVSRNGFSMVNTQLWHFAWLCTASRGYPPLRVATLRFAIRRDKKRHHMEFDRTHHDRSNRHPIFQLFILSRSYCGSLLA